MGILCIVGICTLFTIPEVVLRYKICSSDITVCFVELIVYYICYDLLVSVPHMIYCLTVYCLFISQTVQIICVAGCCFAVCESDKLIKTVISIDCLLYIVVSILPLFFPFVNKKGAKQV